ncbi:MAG TPA: hypothetical protein VFS00_34610, partial [Polyangiaceae bacterium]|nr:hypothetical protein [Polyangiaceae bacterium]
MRGGVRPGAAGAAGGSGAFRGRCVAFARHDVEHVQGLADLFEACHCACFCRYWHFGGDKNAWLARTAHEPAVNRREFFGAVAARNDEARGLVAIDDAGDVVGWMKLAPAPSLSK